MRQIEINSLGKKIKELRKKQNLTQAELAKLIGCAQNTIAEWESEKNRLPGSKHLGELAVALGVSINFLVNSSKKNKNTVPCYGNVFSNNFRLSKIIEYSIEIPNNEFKDSFFALKIKDDLLHPVVEKEDYCIFEEKAPQNNDLVVVTNEKKSAIKMWKQVNDIAVISGIGIDDRDDFILVDLKKKRLLFEYKTKNSSSIKICGILIAVKKSIKILKAYPRIKYIYE